jgi:hypothetical protein
VPAVLSNAFYRMMLPALTQQVDLFPAGAGPYQAAGPGTASLATTDQHYQPLLNWTAADAANTGFPVGRSIVGTLQFQLSTNPVTLLRLPTDLALVADRAYLPFVERYATNNTAFVLDFAAAFSKLLTLGCPAAVRQGGSGRAIFVAAATAPPGGSSSVVGKVGSSGLAPQIRPVLDAELLTGIHAATPAAKYAPPPGARASVRRANPAHHARRCGHCGDLLGPDGHAVLRVRDALPPSGRPDPVPVHG